MKYEYTSMTRINVSMHYLHNFVSSFGQAKFSSGNFGEFMSEGTRCWTHVMNE
jgi:hypothetical protein